MKKLGLTGLILMLWIGGSAAQNSATYQPGYECEGLAACLAELGLAQPAANIQEFYSAESGSVSKGMVQLDSLTPSQKLLPNNVFDERGGEYGTQVQFEGNLAAVSAPKVGLGRSERYG